MTNSEMIEYIYRLSVLDLLEYVIDSPTHLTDSFYAEFRDAIQGRFIELRKEWYEQTTT